MFIYPNLMAGNFFVAMISHHLICESPRIQEIILIHTV